jgi:L-lactate dehydrogenase complex protein LldG
MSAPIESRRLVLDRIRSAIAQPTGEANEKPPRSFICEGNLGAAARLQLMVDRLREYEAEVVECLLEDLAACIADRLQSSGRGKFLAPPGLRLDWQIEKFEWKTDHGLDYAAIEECDGVVTGAFAGVADSGTIVLHHSPEEGRRVITLLPDWHLCVLRTSQIVETLPEYFDRCPHPPPSMATYISGPSATADIEMTRIRGVHGPRFLNVIIVHDEANPETANEHFADDMDLNRGPNETL